MDDLRVAEVDFLTIGQYLQPTVKHAAVARFVTPEEFADYASLARASGFLLVSATPLTRSSYHADADFAALQAARAARRPRRPEHAHARREHASSLSRPDQMCDLVADVDRYPQFLPWCVGAKVRQQTERQQIADMTIGFGPFRENFTSRNALLRPQYIKVRYEHGPFQYLNNDWIFIADPRGCKVDFWIDFEFRSRVLQAAFGVVFHEATRRMVNAFLRRARDIYGPAPAGLPAGRAGTLAQRREDIAR